MVHMENALSTRYGPHILIGRVLRKQPGYADNYIFWRVFAIGVSSGTFVSVVYSWFVHIQLHRLSWKISARYVYVNKCMNI